MDRRLPAQSLTPADFVKRLQNLPRLKNVFNPWQDFDDVNDGGPSAPRVRSAQLTRYLEQRANTTRLVLIAEAPSWRGAKFSGIAMTSERILLDMHPRVRASSVLQQLGERTSSATKFPLPHSEQTATIVWTLLSEIAVSPWEVVLWNAFPCHPHKEGCRRSNRRPSYEELELTKDVLPDLLSFLENPQVVAVGRVAEQALSLLKVSAMVVRHPAKGGATEFRSSMAALFHLLKAQQVSTNMQ